MDDTRPTETQKQAEADFQAIVEFGLPMHIAGRCMGCFDKSLFILRVIMKDDKNNLDLITHDDMECWCKRCFAWYTQCYERFGLDVQKRAMAQENRKEILH